MELATGALHTLLPKLHKLLRDEYNLQKSVKKNVEFLERELESIHVTLRKVSNVPPEQLDEQVITWARNIRELSCDMEDIVDTFLVRVQGPEPPSKRSVKRFIKKMVNIFTKAITRHEIGQQIKDIKERVKDMAEQRDRYKVDAAITPAKTMVDPRILALYTKSTDLVGIDEAKEELITKLTRGDGLTAQKRWVVSIVGFGGLGKTTLAKAVYDELKVQFDCTAFVSVSRNPDIKKLLKDMLYDLDKEKYENIHGTMLEETHLINLVQEFLQNRRNLIVIDDIWDIKAWGIIKCSLGDNHMISRIITTTRIIGIAEQVGDYCYKLKPLTPNCSKILFYGRIFGSQDKCPEQYYEVSEKILNKCGGVPLAIITTSSLLATKLGKENLEVWYQWCDYIGSGLGSDHDIDNMRKILSFSYYDLPSHLKICLLCLSIFPEDCEILRDRLIWRWIAEGFVQHGDEGRESLFDIGLSYFNELINRCLIQPGSMIDDIMSPESFRVHDMVLDLICSLSRDEGFVTTVFGDSRQSTVCSRSKVRRLSLHNSTTWPTTVNTSKLRSLTIFDSAIISLVPSLSFCYLLRVLDLEGCNLKGLPNLEFLGHLVHVRSLSLRNTGYAGDVPEQIGNLQFLQTLELTGNDIKELPSTILALRQLRCLGVGDTTRLPNGLRSLTCLEALVARNVHSAHIVDELGHLTQLRILIICLRNDPEGTWNESVCKALVETIGKLRKIHTLAVTSAGAVAADLEGSLESLGNLKQLSIMNISLMPKWIHPASLLLLSFLQLKVAQVRREDIQVLGMLPALRVLSVEGNCMQVGEKLMVSADAFPCVITCHFLGFLVVPSMFPPGAMPKLENIFHGIPCEVFFSGELTGDDFAIGHLPSLQIMTLVLNKGAHQVSDEVVSRVATKLRHETDIHPNHPRIGFFIKTSNGTLAA